MNSISRWSLDEDKELNGTWVSLGHGEKVKIRPGGAIGNEDQAEFIQNCLSKRGFNDPDEAPDETVNEVLVESIANCVLLDWSGFTGKDGKELPATLENKVMMLSEKVFRNRIAKEAQKMEHFRIKEENNAVKN